MENILCMYNLKILVAWTWIIKKNNLYIFKVKNGVNLFHKRSCYCYQKLGEGQENVNKILFLLSSHKNIKHLTKKKHEFFFSFSSTFPSQTLADFFRSRKDHFPFSSSLHRENLLSSSADFDSKRSEKRQSKYHADEKKKKISNFRSRKKFFTKIFQRRKNKRR